MTVQGAGTKPDLVIWTGPVWAGNLSKVNWVAETEIMTLSCEGSDNCAAIASNLPATRRLEALLALHGRKVDQYGHIMLGSFSAGHGLSNLLLKDPESRKYIRAFGAFDSYYTGPAPGLKDGYLAFAKEAAEGSGKFMWTSCSSIPDRKWLSCEDSIKPLLDAIGPSEDSLPSDLADKIKSPVYFVSKYGFVHAAYGTKYKHAEHATVVAPAVFEAWFGPMLRDTPASSIVQKAGIALGALAAAAGAWKLGKWLKDR